MPQKSLIQKDQALVLSLVLYSCLMASKALIFTARFAGEKPDIRPISVANTIPQRASHGGITDKLLPDPIPIMEKMPPEPLIAPVPVR